MKNAMKLFSATILLLLIPGFLYAREESYNNNNAGVLSGTEEDSGIQDEKIANYPFTKSESQLESENVVGMKIDKKGTTLFSNENTYYTENSGEGNNFSNINIFSQYPKLISVEFRNLTFSGQDLENIRNFINENRESKIKNLSFSSCVIDEKDIEYITDTISKLNDLKSITIKFLKTKNKKGKTEAISSKAVEEITKVLSEKKNITSLTIAFNQITVDSLNHINSMIKLSPNMKMLSLLWDDVIGNEREEAYKTFSDNLAELKNLKHLYLSLLYVPESCIDGLFDSISKQNTLTNLTLLIKNLKESKNAYEHASNLAKAISELPALSSIRLQNMQLPANAVQPIIKSFEKLSKLSYIDLSNNKIDKNAATVFADTMKNNEKLKVLNMRKCSINADSFAEISKVFGSLPLVVICFGENKIKEGISNLQLSENTSLRFIDMAKNSISSDAIINFISSTITHNSLKKVDLRGNCNMEKQRDKIERLKSDNDCTIAYLLECKEPKKKQKVQSEPAAPSETAFAEQNFAASSSSSGATN